MSDQPFIEIDGVKVNPSLAGLLHPISDLTPSPDNARAHSDRNIRAIRRSLERWGFQAPVVVRPSGEIVVGHGRLEAAQRIGWTKVPVLTFNGGALDATAFAIADNRTAELAKWDPDMLAGVLSELKQAQEDLVEDTGFTMSEFEAMLPGGENGEDKGKDGATLYEIRIERVPPSRKDEILAMVSDAVSGMGLHADAY